MCRELTVEVKSIAMDTMIWSTIGMQRLLVHKNEMSSFQTTNDIVFT